ncbi:DoxX family protein [Streptomyces palmae]|nr:DoxX family protein [Streptomyces palmae]
MAKVPCDPAQVIVSHASFRVQLARPVRGRSRVDAARTGQPPGARRRRAPVVWSGHTVPGGDPAAQLLQAVRQSGRTWAAGAEGEEPAGATRVIPRVALQDPPTLVIKPRLSQDGTERLPVVRPGRPAYGGARPGTPGTPGAGLPGGPDPERDGDPDDAPGGEPQPGHRRGRTAGAANANAGVRHAYYPARRLNLGIVLLPMRIFLGLISVYAGLGKLADPVYFDGGERGSMVKWLRSLDPWPVAEPLRDFALNHPVGAGLSVAFIQVVVGVLTVMGLWQRVAAGFGAALSAALLVTVSWRTLPAYDAPDIIYLAAWSPLIIAGAPVYSMDARLTGEAWRRLGPRVELWQLRRRVLRRGGLTAAVVCGLTLLFGAMLGGAVRSSHPVHAPHHGDSPHNSLPGSPLPQPSGHSTRHHAKRPAHVGGSPSAAQRSASPSTSASPAAPRSTREAAPTGTGGAGGVPSQTQSVPQGTRPQAPRRPVAPPAAPSGPTTSAGGGTPSGSASGGGGGSASGGSGSTSGGGGALGGLLG